MIFIFRDKGTFWRHLLREIEEILIVVGTGGKVELPLAIYYVGGLLGQLGLQFRGSTVRPDEVLVVRSRLKQRHGFRGVTAPALHPRDRIFMESNECADAQVFPRHQEGRHPGVLYGAIPHEFINLLAFPAKVAL